MARTATPMKLKDRLAADPVSAVTPLRPENLAASVTGDSAKPEARKGKKATVGHFSDAMSRRLNALAAMEGRTLQSMMGEAWDMLLVKYGVEPFNER